MQYKRSHPHEELLDLVSLDYEQNMGLVVAHSDSGCEEIIGLSRYDVDQATQRADIAFVVRDEWQRRGVGTLLMRRMAEVAQARGLEGFSADVLASNKPMMAIFQKSGLPVKANLDGGCYHLEVDFP
jgi:GNAT superfamily N-acetyltransferase